MIMDYMTDPQAQPIAECHNPFRRLTEAQGLIKFQVFVIVNDHNRVVAQPRTDG